MNIFEGQKRNPVNVSSFYEYPTLPINFNGTWKLVRTSEIPLSDEPEFRTSKFCVEDSSSTSLRYSRACISVRPS